MPIPSFVRITVLGFVFAVATVPLLAESPAKELKTYRHFRIERPAHLSQAEALTVYDNIRDELGDGYAASEHPSAKTYRMWRRYNSAPYRSATHGNRYVNNYANRKAKGYGKLKRGERMPAGAVFAKDSFTVTSDGAVFGGALFIMEKLAPGTRPESGDWRYIMIMPDGSYFGDSEGVGAEGVTFCHTCHKTAGDQDMLFYVPKGYQRSVLIDPG